MKKKLFAILLSIVMVVGLLPVTALAADPTVYGIWVDGVQVTSENKDNLCSGTVSYEPTTHTLSLNNATLDNDTMSDYGINTIIPSTLKIRLTGTNSITRTDPYGGMGIAPNSSNSVEITGDGTLVINVIGENYDGISTGADVKISDKARVIINSKGGLGIAGRMVEIDGATLNSTGLYAGIDAHRLKIVNGADVTLKATQDGRNGAYIWKDQEGNGGDIELAASKVKATSYYPGLYAAGNLTVNGGEVNCTSTADGAIWAKGNILIKGGAKVTTDGKFPMGGNGTFTVEEAEIDAKNTNENNIPAIFDKCVPVIADGYHLNYAKAVDSEGTEIDLLSSGTQYFALYKNVHFITKAVYPVSFVVTPDGLTNVVVKVNGQEVTGSVSLEAGTYPVEVTADNCKAYTGNITITSDTATHTQTIAMTYLPADYTKVDEAIAKANALNKDAYTDFTAVEAAINAVVRDKNITEQDEVDAMAKAIEDAYGRVGGKAHSGSDRDTYGCTFYKPDGGSDRDTDGNAYGCTFCKPDGGSDRDTDGNAYGCTFYKPDGGSDRDTYGKTDGYAFCKPDGGSDRDAYGKTDGYAFCKPDGSSDCDTDRKTDGYADSGAEGRPQ